MRRWMLAALILVAAMFAGGYALASSGSKISRHTRRGWWSYPPLGRPADGSSAPTSYRRSVINLGPPVERLRTFTGGGLRFRYPASWRAYRWNESSTMSALIVDLSNQPEHPPCTIHRGTHNTTIRCRDPLSRLRRDSVLAEWSSNGMVGFRLAGTPGTPTRIGGRPAREQVTAETCGIGAARSLTAVISVPGGNSYIEFRACLSGPNPSLQERRVRALLATVHW